MSSRNELIVYLAGGMHGNWRNTVKSRMLYARWIDPMVTKKQKSPEKYTTWELLGIHICDVVFAYLEKDNPSGLGLMLEIGYGKALGKTVIFIDEKNNSFTQMGRQVADCVCDTLDEGIDFLISFERLIE